jgi:hypothetical protein
MSPLACGLSGGGTARALSLRSGSTMSQRAHFWLRILGLAAILAAEFGPRLWSNASNVSPASVSAAVADR